MWTCPKCGERIEDQFDSCWKCAGTPENIGLPLSARTKQTRKQAFTGFLFALGIIPATILCFGPIYGFHHMVGFGVTFYLMLNGEDPRPDDRTWGDYAVAFFPSRFVGGLVIWLVCIFIIFRVVRFLIRKVYVA